MGGGIGLRRWMEEMVLVVGRPSVRDMYAMDGWERCLVNAYHTLAEKTFWCRPGWTRS